jgi:hypothetical protein
MVLTITYQIALLLLLLVIYINYIAALEGGCPMTTKPVMVSQHINIWSWVPKGARRQEGLSDGPSVKWRGLGLTQQRITLSVHRYTIVDIVIL